MSVMDRRESDSLLMLQSDVESSYNLRSEKTIFQTYHFGNVVLGLGFCFLWPLSLSWLHVLIYTITGVYSVRNPEGERYLSES
jgi:hypothetical protein